jgi:23S rRNA pseudouridine2605 synthase
MALRLAKFLEKCGVASRRKCEEIIFLQRVTVNGGLVVDPATAIDPEKDRVAVEGVRVRTVGEKVYFALYKPAGYLSDLTTKDDRRLARSLIDDKRFLFPVGRLDYWSEGLILFTNDGDVANWVSHPRYQMEKEYHVKVKGSLGSREIERFVDGIRDGNQTLRAREVECIDGTKRNYWYRVVLVEGKNRMIRRMCDRVGHPVMRLRRVRIGPVELGNLSPGGWRKLREGEIRELNVSGVAKAAEGGLGRSEGIKKALP